jgi:hypothetical protein
MVEPSPVSAVLLSSVTGAAESALAAELRESVELVAPGVDVPAAGRDGAASVTDSGANAPLTRARAVATEDCPEPREDPPADCW